MTLKSSLARYVTIPRFAELSGLTESAIRTRIKGGIWPRGKVYVKAQDGSLLIDIEGYNEWMDGSCSNDLLALPDEPLDEPPLDDATSSDHGERSNDRRRPRSETSAKEAVLEILRRKAERLAQKRMRGKN